MLFVQPLSFGDTQHTCQEYPRGHSGKPGYGVSIAFRENPEYSPNSIVRFSDLPNYTEMRSSTAVNLPPKLRIHGQDNWEVKVPKYLRRTLSRRSMSVYTNSFTTPSCVPPSTLDSRFDTEVSLKDSLCSTLSGSLTVDIVCESCQDRITDPTCLLVGARHRHLHCLRCSVCQVDLQWQKTCFSHHGRIFCQAHYERMLRCHRCDGRFHKSDRIHRVTQSIAYHYDCLLCVTCSRLLVSGDAFVFHKDSIYCVAHREVEQQRLAFCWQSVSGESETPADVPKNSSREADNSERTRHGLIRNDSTTPKTSPVVMREDMTRPEILSVTDVGHDGQNRALPGTNDALELRQSPPHFPDTHTYDASESQDNQSKSPANLDVRGGGPIVRDTIGKRPKLARRFEKMKILEAEDNSHEHESPSPHLQHVLRTNTLPEGGSIPSADSSNSLKDCLYDTGNVVSETPQRQSSKISKATNRHKRVRTSFKHHQLGVMRAYFEISQNPDSKDLRHLSQTTGLPKRVLQVWFQNARAKYRRSAGKLGQEFHLGPDSVTSYETNSESLAPISQTHLPSQFTQFTQISDTLISTQNCPLSTLSDPWTAIDTNPSCPHRAIPSVIMSPGFYANASELAAPAILSHREKPDFLLPSTLESTSPTSSVSQFYSQDDPFCNNLCSITFDEVNSLKHRPRLHAC